MAVKSSGEFSLDTKSFSSAAEKAKTLANEMEDMQSECDKEIDALLFSWAGKGRNSFEKKYHIFKQQLRDLKNGLWDLYEDIIAAEESYIQADVDSAKALDGKTARYTNTGAYEATGVKSGGGGFR